MMFVRSTRLFIELFFLWRQVAFRKQDTRGCSANRVERFLHCQQRGRETWFRATKRLSTRETHRQIGRGGTSSARRFCAKIFSTAVVLSDQAGIAGAISCGFFSLRRGIGDAAPIAKVRSRDTQSHLKTIVSSFLRARAIDAAWNKFPALDAGKAPQRGASRLRTNPTENLAQRLQFHLRFSSLRKWKP